MMSPMRCQGGRRRKSEDSKTDKNASGHSRSSFVYPPKEQAENPMAQPAPLPSHVSAMSCSWVFVARTAEMFSLQVGVRLAIHDASHIEWNAGKETKHEQDRPHWHLCRDFRRHRKRARRARARIKDGSERRRRSGARCYSRDRHLAVQGLGVFLWHVTGSRAWPP